MKQISELQSTLAYFLDWNKARMACLVQILQALFRVRTVNLTQIAEAFQTTAKEESSYRRIQRFFQGFSFDMSFIVILVLHLFIMDGKFILIIDRTNSKWGKKHINILMLSVGGTSSSRDRTALLQRVIHKFGSHRIEVLLADREFIGEAWFRFLIAENVPFVIRVKQNFVVEGIRKGYAVPISELLKNLGHKKKHINHPIVLWGHELYASVEHAKGAKEPMIVASNRSWPNPLKLYRWRWGIETLFGCLKTRGFRMEDTHMTDPEKIEKLLFILAIAFCWAYKTGELQARKTPIPIKNHGRKAQSVFRLGLNRIRSTLMQIDKPPDPLLSLLRYCEPLKSPGCSI